VSKQFWGFFAIALAAVAVVVSIVWFGSVSAHLVLKATILKVRTLQLSDGASSIAVVDFRLKNPSAVPFVVKDVVMTMEPQSGQVVTGSPVSKSDVTMVFQAHPVVGPKFNDVLSLRDTIPGGQTLDFMVAARFDLPSSALDQRKSIHLHLEDLDGTVTDFSETQ
jgi:hypothetical protein